MELEFSPYYGPNKNKHFPRDNDFVVRRLDPNAVMSRSKLIYVPLVDPPFHSSEAD